MTDLTLDEALLVLNDWLGQSVLVAALIRLNPDSSEPPPVGGRGPGWHLVFGREGKLRQPDVSEHGPDHEDGLRQLNIGTYEIGDGPSKLLLDGMPTERILAQEDRRLAFYLPGSATVLLIEQL